MAYSDKLLLATLQPDRNTFVAPAPATHAVRTRNLRVQPIVSGQLERNLDSATGGRSPSVPTDVHRRVTFETELTGSGAAGSAPADSIILRGTGHSVALVAAVSCTHEPLSEATEALSLAGYHDGQLFELGAAVGTSTFSFQANNYPYGSHEFLGLYRPISDAAVPANADFAAWRDPLKIDQGRTTFQWGGVTLPMSSFELTMARPLVFRDIPGYRGGRALDRVPTFRLTVDKPSIATVNLYQQVADGTASLVKIVHGTVAGDIVELQAYCQPEGQPDLGDDNTITTLTLTGRVVKVGQPFDYRLIRR